MTDTPKEKEEEKEEEGEKEKEGEEEEEEGEKAAAPVMEDVGGDSQTAHDEGNGMCNSVCAIMMFDVPYTCTCSSQPFTVYI